MTRYKRLVNKAMTHEYVEFKRIPLGKITKVIEDMGFELNESETHSSFGCNEMVLVFDRGSERFEIYMEVPTFECTLTYMKEE